MKLIENPMFYASLLLLPINFLLSFTAFFGEEYGWRYYFAPFLQKRFGKVKGVLLVGVVWGLWHLPINLFYYSPQTWLQSIIGQQITCIALGIFFTYAYMKTNNIWVPAILHFFEQQSGCSFKRRRCERNRQSGGQLEGFIGIAHLGYDIIRTIYFDERV